MVAAPFLLYVAPDLMPETLLVATVGLPLFMLRSEGGDADIKGLRWAIGGRVPGMLLGVTVLAAAQTRMLGLLVALSVLASVAVSILMMKRRLAIRRSGFSLALAGGISGFTGTTVAVGGPPMALVYQDESGGRVRATLAVYFLFGALSSLVMIAAFGLLDVGAALVGLACLPIVVASHYASVRLRTRVDDGVRVGVLAICALAALILLLDSVFGH